VRVALSILTLLAPRLLEATSIEQLHQILRRPFTHLRQHTQQTFFKVSYQKITLHKERLKFLAQSYMDGVPACNAVQKEKCFA